MDGTPITDTSMWRGGQPDAPGQNCGYFMKGHSLIDDGNCGAALSFICEVDKGREDFFNMILASLSEYPKIDQNRDKNTKISSKLH